MEAANGDIELDDGSLAFMLSMPKELDVDGRLGASPEQLHASDYLACFLIALRFVAGRRGSKCGMGRSPGTMHGSFEQCPCGRDSKQELLK